MKDPTPSRRTALALAASMVLSGCWGSFGAAKALYRMNDRASSNKWLKWLLFFSLAFIVPAYELFLLGDVLIFNVIEFFSGSNPISSSQRDLGNGHSVAMQRSREAPGLVEVTHLYRGQPRATFHVRTDGEHMVELFDDERRLLARVEERPFGEWVLQRPGKKPWVLGQDEVERLAEGMERGESPTALVRATQSAAARASDWG